MKLADHLRRYAAFNIWANQKMADWLGTLDDATFEKEVENSFPSLKKTAWHIHGAENAWHQRLNGASPSSFPNPGSVGGAAEVFEKLLASSRALADLVSDKDDDWFDTSFDYKNIAGQPFTSVRRDVVQHVINHSTYHRGQLLTMGRQLGLKNPPSTDFLFYSREA